MSTQQQRVWRTDRHDKSVDGVRISSIKLTRAPSQQPTTTMNNFTIANATSLHFSQACSIVKKAKAEDERNTTSETSQARFLRKVQTQTQETAHTTDTTTSQQEKTKSIWRRQLLISNSLFRSGGKIA
ncbi:hypothetical protein Poli38472_003449 [Pythium oligandrum]|uniref:Uncharacterized protein n=1 Tax=Pythium oligandrum TaxID=41045 RepID=A0A8K1FE29_PYTOL|nr:hypothetical protein Poli38472_003449 [Pythium oligandrum]|eukprot:TMW57524.1 hypothetical protein Poli38472_003449 [Pythium oligandrum]